MRVGNALVRNRWESRNAGGSGDNKGKRKVAIAVNVNKPVKGEEGKRKEGGLLNRKMGLCTGGRRGGPPVPKSSLFEENGGLSEKVGSRKRSKIFEMVWEGSLRQPGGRRFRAEGIIFL